MFDPIKFGERVRVVMARRQIGVREAADEIGVSHATVSRVARGKPPDVFNLERFTRWLERNERKRA